MNYKRFQSQPTLTKLQKQRCTDYFNSFKKTGSMKLKKEEIQRMFAVIGIQVTQEQVFNIMQDGHLNGKIEMDYDTFEDIMLKCCQSEDIENNEQARNVFNYLLIQQQVTEGDSNLTTISIQNLAETLKQNFGINLPPYGMDQYLQPKSRLTFQDFCSYLNQK